LPSLGAGLSRPVGHARACFSGQPLKRPRVDTYSDRRPDAFPVKQWAPQAGSLLSMRGTSQLFLRKQFSRPARPSASEKTPGPQDWVQNLTRPPRGKLEACNPPPGEGALRPAGFFPTLRATEKNGEFHAGPSSAVDRDRFRGNAAQQRARPIKTRPFPRPARGKAGKASPLFDQEGVFSTKGYPPGPSRVPGAEYGRERSPSRRARFPRSKPC